MKDVETASGRSVSRETLELLERFREMLLHENASQNLISKASEPELWTRHILDSAQLLRFAPAAASWTDIGTGPGLPGVVIAILDPNPVILIEPRRKRVDFLTFVKRALSLFNVKIIHGRADAARSQTDFITARAVASPGELFGMSSHLRHAGTTYILPRGRSAQSELAELGNTWQGEFTLHRSLTSDEASILVARNVRRRGPR